VSVFSVLVIEAFLNVEVAALFFQVSFVTLVLLDL